MKTESINTRRKITVPKSQQIKSNTMEQKEERIKNNLKRASITIGAKERKDHVHI